MHAALIYKKKRFWRAFFIHSKTRAYCIHWYVKYFGKNATENLPKSATKENINVFTDFIVSAKDKQGRGINDPFFDRESIDFSIFTRAVDDVPFRTGGRVGFKAGSKCINRAIAKLKSGNLTSAEKKIVDALGDGLGKGGGMPKKGWTMKSLVKGPGFLFTPYGKNEK